MSQRDDSRYWFGMDKHTVPQGSQYWEDKRTGMDKHRQKPDEEIENPENIDFSFVCMAAEINMDKKETEKVEQLEKEKGIQQHHYTEHWIEFNGNEDQLLQDCEKNLEFLKKYILWSNGNIENIKSGNKNFTVAHEALEDYLTTRVLNIHNILEPFFLHGNISPENYSEYIGLDNLLQDSLQEDINNEGQLNNRNMKIINYCKHVNECILPNLKGLFLGLY